MTDDLHGLAAAYALDALDPDEQRAFEAHLESCPGCTDDVRRFRGTVLALAETAPHPPPAALRQRVLAEIAATPQQAPAPTGAGSSAGRRSAPRPSPTTGVGSTGRPIRLAAALTAAAAVVAAALGGAVLYRDVAAERDRARELAAALAAPDARTVQLAPADGAAAGSGDGTVLRVVWSPTAGATVVVGAGLAAPGDGRVYELWALSDDGPSPVGLFTPDEEGRVERLLEVAVDEPGVGWGVTIEPEGGSPAPTGDVLFQGAA